MLDKFDLSMWRNGRTRLLMLVSLALLSGCASSVVVKPDIPNPLVQRLPLNTGLVYTDAFKDYVYLESEKKRGSLKSLDFADAQTTMFEQVFGALTNLVEVDDPSRTLSIEPQILDFQYTSPSETKLKQYEIWIKYRLKLRDANDASIADWTVKGYGKTPTGLLTSASAAFNSATNVALRDVGAQLSTRFSRQRVVKTLLDGGAPTPIPELEPEAEKAVELAVNDTKADADAKQTDEQPSFDDAATNSADDQLNGDDESSQPNAEEGTKPSAEGGDETDTEVSDET